MTLGTSRQYWIDSSMREAIQILIFTGSCHIEMVDELSSGDGEDGLVCYQETHPVGALSLPKHIGGLDRYTERNCRDLFRSIVARVQIFHDTSVSHRNLHPENVLIDSNVRMFYC
jgi:serine/threonine protein kinase